VFQLIWKFILGIVVGLVARFLLPGADPLGLLMTGLVGVVGSFGGHFLASALGLESGKRPTGRLVSALISIAGAMALLLILRCLR